MSKKYLGDTFDIHGGGMDNMFPHHDCEIAQSEAANDKPFVKYFMHNNLVTVNGQKMGKSLGNSASLNDIFKRYDPLVIRFYTLLSHYRKPTDFSDNNIEEARKNYESIVKAVSKISGLDNNYTEDKEITNIKNKFLEAMDDDFNTALAISYIYELVKIINSSSDENKLKNINDLFNSVISPILGLTFNKSNNNDNKEDELIKYIIELRNKARSEKRFDLSDEIRDKLLNIGITLKDGREGTTYEK
jgi:cysteinyl-tRNA synthetase